MNPLLMLLALLFVVPALFSTDRPLQARSNTALGTGASPQAIVEANLLDPLQRKDVKRPKFSRAAPPPSARRIRILDDKPKTDAMGRTFVSFAIDETHSFREVDSKEVAENQWHRDTIVGCVYPQSGEVIVKMGEANYPASVLWGSAAGKAPVESCLGS
jgi:hypothetical protein